METTHREDGTLVAWYRSLYAPRTGGAYDSHHRTAGIVGRARRRGGGVAALGARATGLADNHRISQQPITRRGQRVGGRVPLRPANKGLRRWPKRRDRIPLGRG